MAVRQYIGARYVPVFYSNSDGNSEWVSGIAYEPLTMVTFNGNTFCSKKAVNAAVGNPANNPEYWANIGFGGAQISEIYTRLGLLENRKVSGYETLSALRISSDIEAGMLCRTGGYRSPGDCGGALYLISDTAPESGHCETLSDGLYGILLSEGYVTPEMFGAYGDGVTNDSAAINAAIAYRQVKFVNGRKYRANIVTPLNVYVNIDLNGCEIEGNITVQKNEGQGYFYAGRTIIKNGTVHSTEELAAIDVKARAFRTHLEDLYVRTRHDGIVCGELGDIGGDCSIINCFINVENGYENTSGVGIRCNATDNKINNCRIYGFKTGIKLRSLDLVDNVHFLYRGDFATNWAAACAFEIENNPVITNCYIDSYKTGFRLSGNSSPVIDNLTFFSWRENTEITAFVDTGEYLGRLMISNWTLNLANVTAFKTLKNDANATYWNHSQVNNIYCDAWGKVFEYDILRETLRPCFYSSAITAGEFRLIGRYYVPYPGGFYLRWVDYNAANKEVLLYVGMSVAGAGIGQVIGGESLEIAVEVTAGRWIDVYLRDTARAWYYRYAENNSDLIDIVPVIGPANPLPRN